MYPDWPYHAAWKPGWPDGTLAGGATELDRAGRDAQELEDRLGQRSRVFRGHEVAGDAVHDELGDAAGVDADDGEPARHRLGDREAEALAGSGVCEHVRAGVNLLRVAHLAGPLDRAVEPEAARELAQLALDAAGPGDHEAAVAQLAPDELRGAEQDGQPLLVLEPADVGDDRVRKRGARRPRRLDRVLGGDVDPGGDDLERRATGVTALACRFRGALGDGNERVEARVDGAMDGERRGAVPARPPGGGRLDEVLGADEARPCS